MERTSPFSPAFLPFAHDPQPPGATGVTGEHDVSQLVLLRADKARNPPDEG